MTKYINIILHLATGTNRPGQVFRKLQEHSKHGLHFRSFYQFKNLTVAAESYQEAAESNQTRLLWLRKRHKVEKINLLRRQTEEHRGVTNLWNYRPRNLWNLRNPRNLRNLTKITYFDRNIYF